MQYTGAYTEGDWPPADALEPAPAPASAESSRSTTDGPLTSASSSAAISAAAAKLAPLRSTGSFWAAQPATSQVCRSLLTSHCSNVQFKLILSVCVHEVTEQHGA